MHYQMKTACERCGAVRMCLWIATGDFQGGWVCGPCYERERFNDGLTDMGRDVRPMPHVQEIDERGTT